MRCCVSFTAGPQHRIVPGRQHWQAAPQGLINIEICHALWRRGGPGDAGRAPAAGTNEDDEDCGCCLRCSLCDIADAPWCYVLFGAGVHVFAAELANTDISSIGAAQFVALSDRALHRALAGGSVFEAVDNS